MQPYQPLMIGNSSGVFFSFDTPEGNIQVPFIVKLMIVMKDYRCGVMVTGINRQ